VLLARTNNGLAEVAVFAAGFSWAQAVLFIPAQIVSPAIALLAKLFANSDINAFRKLLKDSMRAAVALPLALGSSWIMRAYGKEFAGHAATLGIIAIAYAIGAVTIMFRGTLF